MKFHIVRNNEKIDDILFLYNISLSEIKENNKHIRSWDRLIAGTKLKIPAITKADDLEISEMEPFIEDYYPTIDTVLDKEEPHIQTEEIVESEVQTEEETDDEEDEVNNTRVIYYPYYGYYNTYYYRRY